MMRHLWVPLAFVVGSCATGTGLSSTSDDDETVGANGGGAQVGPGSGGAPTNTSGQGGAGGVGCSPGETPCAGSCADLNSDPSNCGNCGEQCLLGESCSNGNCVPDANGTSVSSSSASTSVSSTSASTSVSSSSTGGGNCNPLDPAVACGANNHCVPQPSGVPLCSGPIGVGAQYSSCTTSAQCAAIYECVNTPYATTYCMQWCQMGSACPSFFDACVGLAPAVYVGAQEWGVCYDGFP
jgi:hypothetical protein